MAAPSQGEVSSVDLLDAYFRRADLDRDGRISGAEAFAFFQGSNLPHNVLFQIWSYANQNGTGFLGRTEFYNSLKLVTIAQSKQELTPNIVRAAFYGRDSTNIPAPLINLPATLGLQPNPVITPQVGATSSAGSLPVSSGLVPAALSSTNQQVTVEDFSCVPAAQAQQQWPRLTQSDLRRYTEVFVKVDKDKNGKITSEEAHNLFLSWGLQREIVKQVWDLSDQDEDDMLSLREFCIALYLMEREREQRPLPSVLPSHIMYDFPPAVQGGFGHAAWGYSHGPQQPLRPGFGPYPLTHLPSGSRPSMPGVDPRPPTRPPSGKPPLAVPTTFADNRAQPKEQKTKVPVLEKHLVDQLSEDEQKSLNSKFQQASEANKKVEELEKRVKESREKMEFYRTKMQELVLYKSRCDTRLNETTVRVSSDKHEVDLLAKKYEEKYRQTSDVASRLTIEEATFRDIQERKMELYKAIFRPEQGGSTDESLKARVEQLQSSLEELLKSLNERSKTYGLRAKPTTLAELPFGWQSSIQAGAADWDEDWDTFEDEGFTSVKELTLDVKNIGAPPKTKATSAVKRKSDIVENGKVPPSGAGSKTETLDSVFKETDGSETSDENTGSVAQWVTENGSAHEQADAFEVRSPIGSSAAKSHHESPQKEFQIGYSVKAVGWDASPRSNKITSDHRGAESSFSGYESSDEPGWVIGHNDDTKGMEDDDLFEPGGFNINPIKTSSKFGDSRFLKKGSSIFADSVPSSPFSSSYSPRNVNEGPDEHLSSFSRFDSFKSTDHEYDDSYPFDSTETHTPQVDLFGTPRIVSDPFSYSGSFKSPFTSETPKGTKINWSAF